MEPYYADRTVTLYHGDMREVLPALGVETNEQHIEAAAKRLSR
jgi:hypothetical protein